jgi:hypothetical protein
VITIPIPILPDGAGRATQYGLTLLIAISGQLGEVTDLVEVVGFEFLSYSASLRALAKYCWYHGLGGRRKQKSTDKAPMFTRHQFTASLGHEQWKQLSN